MPLKKIDKTNLPKPQDTILDIPVWGLNRHQFAELALDIIKQNKKALFSTANANAIVVAQESPELMEHFKQADVILPDGILPVWSARVRGNEMAERVPGPTFTETFLNLAEKNGISVYFMGSTEETLAKMKENCERNHPNLELAGFLSPPFGDFDETTNNNLIKQINDSHADALFVGMTAPKQELWLSQNFDKIDVPFQMGVGAAFDFIAGNVVRVPDFLGQHGLEWLYRLVQEPKRMWRRNINSAIFLYLFGKKSLKDKLSIR